MEKIEKEKGVKLGPLKSPESFAGITASEQGARK